MATTKILLLGAAALAALAGGALLARAAGARRLHQDARQLFAEAEKADTAVFSAARLAGLPAPVQRYFRHVLTEGQPALRGLRLRHTGRFKTDLRNDWVAITGEQYITAQPAGFIWQDTTAWFKARDELRRGRGQLTVRLLGLVPIVRGAGPSFDQGELLRWLAECAWLPTRLLPGPDLRWAAVDDHSARLSFEHRGTAGSYLVRFNQQNEIGECETLRYQADGQLRPWVGCFWCYRLWHGVRVPTVLEASWVVNGQRQAYAHFVVQDLDYEHLQPYNQ